MKKIPSLFKRDYEGTRLVYDEIVPGSEWVTNGEGVAARKYDGTCCLIENGALWKRYELKPGKAAPDGFRPADDVDEVTGKQQGWVPVSPDDKADKWHREAFYYYSMDQAIKGIKPESEDFNGTFELVGPKIQGNPENYDSHMLIPHDDTEGYSDCPRDFEGVKQWLAGKNIEGIVWQHPDGRMVKIKKKDFGLARDESHIF